MSMSCVRTGASSSTGRRRGSGDVRRGLQRHDVIRLDVEHFREPPIPGHRLRRRQSARQLDQVEITDGGEAPQAHGAGGPADGRDRPEQREQNDGERSRKPGHHRCSPSRPDRTGHVAAGRRRATGASMAAGGATALLTDEELHAVQRRAEGRRADVARAGRSARCARQRRAARPGSGRPALERLGHHRPASRCSLAGVRRHACSSSRRTARPT